MKSPRSNALHLNDTEFIKLPKEMANEALQLRGKGPEYSHSAVIERLVTFQKANGRDEDLEKSFIARASTCPITKREMNELMDAVKFLFGEVAYGTDSSTQTSF